MPRGSDPAKKPFDPKKSTVEDARIRANALLELSKKGTTKEHRHDPRLKKEYDAINAFISSQKGATGKPLRPLPSWDAATKGEPEKPPPPGLQPITREEPDDNNGLFDVPTVPTAFDGQLLLPDIQAFELGPDNGAAPPAGVPIGMAEMRAQEAKVQAPVPFAAFNRPPTPVQAAAPAAMAAPPPRVPTPPAPQQETKTNPWGIPPGVKLDPPPPWDKWLWDQLLPIAMRSPTPPSPWTPTELDERVPSRGPSPVQFTDRPPAKRPRAEPTPPPAPVQEAEDDPIRSLYKRSSARDQREYDATLDWIRTQQGITPTTAPFTTANFGKFYPMDPSITLRQWTAEVARAAKQTLATAGRSNALQYLERHRPLGEENKAALDFIQEQRREINRPPRTWAEPPPFTPPPVPEVAAAAAAGPGVVNIMDAPLSEEPPLPGEWTGLDMSGSGRKRQRGRGYIRSRWF